jgi:hypothetical protein
MISQVYLIRDLFQWYAAVWGRNYINGTVSGLPKSVAYHSEACGWWLESALEGAQLDYGDKFILTTI